MADHLHWWRLEYDVGGTLLSRELAVEPHEDNGLVFFVRAKDIRGAERLGHRLHMRAVTKARHADYRRRGLCKCGRKPDVQGKRLCSFCLKMNVEAKERRRFRDRGEETPKQPRRFALELRSKDDERRIRERLRAEVAAGVRAEVLTEVHAAFMGTPMRLFGAWLVEQLGALGKKVA